MTARDRRASDHERGRARSIRRPGDGWVECGCGQRHWGLNGAAGLLVWRRARRGGPGLEVLLQLRAEWTHQGGTWGLPGGAVSDGESPAQGALRECEEETGLPARMLSLGPGCTRTHPDWSYTTFTAQAPSDGRWDALAPTDGESTALRWVRLSPTADGRWARPEPGGVGASDAGAGAPLLAPLDAAWNELASLLPAPARESAARAPRGAADREERGRTGPVRRRPSRAGG